MSSYLYIAADALAIGLLVFAVYLPRHRRGDMAMAYLIINLGILAVVTVLATSTVAAGLGLGLFGLLSIIRLRSEELSQSEVAYYFAALVLGLIGGLGATSGSYLPLALMAALVVGFLVLDSRLLQQDAERMTVTVDRALTDHAELTGHLAGMFNAEILGAKVVSLDLVKDLTIVQVHMRRHTRVQTPVAEPVSEWSIR